MSDVDALDDVSVLELSQVTAPLGETDRTRLSEFYAHLIARSGAELPSVSRAAVDGSRRSRRVERQRADHLVRVLSTARSAATNRSAVAA